MSTCIDLVAQVVVNRLAIQWFGNRISSATCTVATSPTTVGALLPKHLFVMLTERWGSLNKLWSLNDYGLWMVLVKSSNLSLEIHLSLLWHPVHFVLVAAIHTPAWELALTELSFSLILPQSHISANCSNSFHSDTSDRLITPSFYLLSVHSLCKNCNNLSFMYFCPSQLQQFPP